MVHSTFSLTAGLAARQFTILAGTKPVQVCPSLADQGIQHEQTLQLLPHLLGGATTPGRPAAPPCPPQRQPAHFTPVSDRDTARPRLAQLLQAARNEKNGGSYLGIWQVAADTQQQALELRDVVVAELDKYPSVRGICSNAPHQNRCCTTFSALLLHPHRASSLPWIHPWLRPAVLGGTCMPDLSPLLANLLLVGVHLLPPLFHTFR